MIVSTLCVLGLTVLLLIFSQTIALFYHKKNALSENKKQNLLFYRFIACVGLCACFISCFHSFESGIEAAQSGFDDCMASSYGSFVILSFVLLLMPVLNARMLILTLIMTIGSIMVMAANHFLSLYIGLELMSFALIVMLAVENVNGLMTALRYLVLNAIASCVLLSGILLIYIKNQSLQFSQMHHLQSCGLTDLRHIGLALLTLSMLFKWGVFPMHRWVIDVYRQSSARVLMVQTAIVKLALLIYWMRFSYWIQQSPKVLYALTMITLISMLVSGWKALQAENFRDLMAYSSISHMSLLIGCVTTSETIGFYAVIYMVFYSSAWIGVLWLWRKVPSSIQGLLFRWPPIFLASDEVENDHPPVPVNDPSSFHLSWLLLVMAGFPPSPLFFIKFQMLSCMVTEHSPLWACMMLIVFALTMGYSARLCYRLQIRVKHRAYWTWSSVWAWLWSIGLVWVVLIGASELLACG